MCHELYARWLCKSHITLTEFRDINFARIHFFCKLCGFVTFLNFVAESMPKAFSETSCFMVHCPLTAFTPVLSKNKCYLCMTDIQSESLHNWSHTLSFIWGTAFSYWFNLMDYKWYWCWTRSLEWIKCFFNESSSSTVWQHLSVQRKSHFPNLLLALSHISSI